MFNDKLAQISAAVPVVVHPASISIVFCTPVPTAVPLAQGISVPAQPHSAPVLCSFSAHINPCSPVLSM